MTKLVIQLTNYKFEKDKKDILKNIEKKSLANEEKNKKSKKVVSNPTTKKPKAQTREKAKEKDKSNTKKTPNKVKESKTVKAKKEETKSPTKASKKDVAKKVDKPSKTTKSPKSTSSKEKKIDIDSIKVDVADENIAIVVELVKKEIKKKQKKSPKSSSLSQDEVMKLMEKSNIDIFEEADQIFEVLTQYQLMMPEIEEDNYEEINEKEFLKQLKSNKKNVDDTDEFEPEFADEEDHYDDVSSLFGNDKTANELDDDIDGEDFSYSSYDSYDESEMFQIQMNMLLKIMPI